MTGPNTKALLKNGEKSLRDNVPIRFNAWSSIGGNNLKEVPKHMLVKFSVYTDNLGPGGRKNRTETSIGTKMFQKLDRIEDSPKAAIEVWQNIYNEILPGKPDADPLTVVELFRSHLTGIALKEFDEIQHIAAIDLFDKYIEVNMNSRMCTYGPDDRENSKLSDTDIVQLSTSDERSAAKEVKAWLARNEKRKKVRNAQQGMTAYNYVYPPPLFPAPPAKPKQGMFINWSSTGVSAIGPCAWLRLQNHGWEFAPRFEQLVFQGVQKLAFKTFGEHCGRTQIDHLTEDLEMSTEHNLKRFLQLLQAHSEAQPFYPLMSTDKEVGCVFSESRKIAILWNAAYDLHKDELTNLNITRKDDLRTWEEATTKFILAEERRKAKAPPTKKVPVTAPPKAAPKGGSAQPSDSKCGFCGRPGHLGKNCFSNPKSELYKGAGSNSASGSSNKRAGGGGQSKESSDRKRSKLSYDEWKAKKEYDKYCMDASSDEEEK